ncbi:uncharacterized protein yc1106_04852 [Curvularia clavata]|uniref:Uncharacterized protein n=1 Tax=Curvularia clavata TaxID=95742 RepID=A0A9Q8ZB73_CURCL|nr:uncharacterized protein yc1106_04852 [Curvularia clavata]
MNSPNTSTITTKSSSNSVPTASPPEKPSQTTNLTEDALKEHDANSAVNDHHWAMEEHERIQRLQLAAKELGFELHRKYFHR